MNKSLSSLELQTFQTFVEFVDNLHGVVEQKSNNTVHSFNLYHRLLTGASFQDYEIIKKHVQIITKFCNKNYKKIEQKKLTDLDDIRFSKKVFICLNHFLTKLDSESLQSVWEYLLTLTAMTVPHSNAKNILQNAEKVPPQTPKPSPDMNVFGDLMNVVQESVGNLDEKDAENPMVLMNTLMQSESFKNMATNIGEQLNSGQMDFGSLFGGLTQAMGTFTQTQGHSFSRPVVEEVVEEPVEEPVEEVVEEPVEEVAEEVVEEPVEEVAEEVVEEPVEELVE